MKRRIMEIQSSAKLKGVYLADQNSEHRKHKKEEDRDEEKDNGNPVFRKTKNIFNFYRNRGKTESNH